eukprot:TRINITY_DN415_c0_g1_i1.p1 TRINITY_DN415_c0_g1~~TRINITY_DN415_c0_g1_i1.p1  ORF type:complete len:111 (-),score=27.46 TRINITY_DN415_c0_g1_i1:178-510(-)
MCIRDRERAKKRAARARRMNRQAHGYRKVIVDSSGSLPDDCACSGAKDEKSQGGHCATWGWRNSWCYVNAKCKDRGVLKSKTPPHRTWIQGCLKSNVAYTHPPGWESSTP